MGRLNYTNRKSEGLKLGQVCAKDLTKRIPGASGSKAALRDPVVELDIRNKSLTDAGLVELAQGLVQAYQANTEQCTILRLEELHVADNELTPASFPSFSNVIRLAFNDLRDLDLSNNRLCITSLPDLTAWDDFLRSISRCCVLRRLDLSGNQLGSKAFEVLARVYSQERPVDLVLPPDLLAAVELAGLNDAARSLSMGPATEEQGDTAEDGRRSATRGGSRHAIKSPAKASSPMMEIDLLPVFATTRGLRSVPYIVLTDINMDDASALYLSYIVANHRHPHRLSSRVPAVKAGHPAQQLAGYDAHPHCRGIVYLPNDCLSVAASRVLDLAEEVRSIAVAEIGDISSRVIGNQPRFSPTQPQSPAFTALGHRRRISTFTGGETQDFLIMDLDRARSRLQTNTIENLGHRCNDLWKAAFRMLTVSRVIQKQISWTPPPTAPTSKSKQLIIRTLELPSAPPSPRTINPWGTPLAPKSTNASLSSRPRNRKGSNVTGPKPSPVAAEVPRQAHRRIASVVDREYKSDLPCGFPEHVWSQIMGYAVGASDLLSHGQQRSVLRYAMDRSSLKKERDALGLKEALQIWHCLADMDALAYETR